MNVKYNVDYNPLFALLEYEYKLKSIITGL